MPGAVFIEGDKIDLKTIEEEDLEFLRDGINNPDIRTYLTANRPINLSQQKDFFEEVVSSEEPITLAITDESGIVGIISLEESNDEIQVAKIGIWIAEDYHGKGYGTEAVELITDYGFKELGLHRIYAHAYEGNKASQRIWEKLGFTHEGTLREQIFRRGDFEDAEVFGILKHEWKN